MPIYAQTYRTFDGAVKARFRWWVIVSQELQVLARTRLFVVMIVMGYLHAMLRLLQVVTYDTLNMGPPNPVTQALRNLAMLTVDAQMFFDFVRMQSPLVFLAAMLAGSGMICDDERNNLMEIYFSKPITWRDYVVGKVLALAIVGLGFTAVPGILLVLAHNMLAPSWETLQATYWLPASILGFSCTLVLPCALGVLASSALSRGQRYASIAVFMVLFGDLTVGHLLPTLLHKPSFAIIAFPLAINRLGEALFQIPRPLFGLSWEWSAVYVGAVCLGALWIVCQKVRRAEVAA